MWNEIKCALHRNVLQDFFDFLFNTSHQIKTNLNCNDDIKQWDWSESKQHSQHSKSAPYMLL